MELEAFAVHWPFNLLGPSSAAGLRNYVNNCKYQSPTCGMSFLNFLNPEKQLSSNLRIEMVGLGSLEKTSVV